MLVRHPLCGVSASPDTVLQVTGLDVVFPSGDGVGPVHLEVGAGEAVLVLGPSGSGKSTLLHCLTGAIPHSIVAEVSGSMEVHGTRVEASSVAAIAQHVGAVAQDPETGVCLPDVADELAFPLENHGVDPVAIDAAIDAALGVVGAAAFRDRRTTELSGGELQRIALAAAVVTAPDLLVLDEPTSMLDGVGVDAVRHAVSNAQRATGAAVVLIEHRLDEYAGELGVQGLPRRTVVLDQNGRVLADGPSVAVFDRHAADLLNLGCWLPLDAELHAVFADPRGLDSPDVRRALLAPTESQPVPSDPLSFNPLSFNPVSFNPVSFNPLPPNGGRPDPPRPGGTSTDDLGAEGLSVAAGAATRSARRSRKSRPTPAYLHDLTFRLRQGEVVALVGRNGSGKTTLLTCLAGLSPPLAGRVSGPRAGLVFQNPEHQFTQPSVRREIAFGLSTGSEELVDAAMRRFGLADFAEHNPFQLSGGQKRRLSLAAMLVHDRPFLLADEPGYGLDRHATIAVMRAFQQTAAAGRGVLFSSHDLRTLCTYADRVLVLGEGRLLADTTPWALLHDEPVLTAAGLRVSRLLGWLRDAVTDGTALRLVLQGLDERALPAAVLGRAASLAVGAPGHRP